MAVVASNGAFVTRDPVYVEPHPVWEKSFSPETIEQVGLFAMNSVIFHLATSEMIKKGHNVITGKPAISFEQAAVITLIYNLHNPEIFAAGSPRSYEEVAVLLGIYDGQRVKDIHDATLKFLLRIEGFRQAFENFFGKRNSNGFEPITMDIPPFLMQIAFLRICLIWHALLDMYEGKIEHPLQISLEENEIVGLKTGILAINPERFKSWNELMIDLGSSHQVFDLDGRMQLFDTGLAKAMALDEFRYLVIVMARAWKLNLPREFGGHTSFLEDLLILSANISKHLPDIRETRYSAEFNFYRYLIENNKNFPDLLRAALRPDIHTFYMP